MVLTCFGLFRRNGDMEAHDRIYGTMIRDHLDNYRQMVFLSGPRQSGKTTLAKAFPETKRSPPATCSRRSKGGRI